MDYGFFIDGLAGKARLVKGQAALQEQPLNSNLFDGSTHEIRMSNLNGALTATVDRTISLQANDNTPLAAGNIHFDVDVQSVEFDMLGVCATP